MHKFAATHWMSCGIPWDSLKCEPRPHAGLLLLLKGDWTNRWCPEVSLPGCLRVLERSRFRGRCGSKRVWEDAFQQLGLADQAPEDESHEMEYVEVADFPENLWHLVDCGRFRAGRGHFATRNTVRASGGAVCV